MKLSALLSASAILASLVVAGPTHADTFGTWGVDLSTRDVSVKPGDDFQRYASGKWIAATTIPADRPGVGAFSDLHDSTQAQLQKLITEAPKGSKYGALYASFMDEKRVEALKLKPLKTDLVALAAITNKTDFTRFMAGTMGTFGISLVDFGTGPDTVDPNKNVLWLSQGGIGLPEREYYFDKQFAKQRSAYIAYIARTLKAIGTSNALAAAQKVMAFETRVAEKSWKVADRRDIVKINNPMGSTELASFAPGIEWTDFFEAANIPAQPRIIVGENTAIRDLAALYAQTPLSTLKLWQAFHVADQASPYLNKAMVNSRFAYTSTISGVTQLRPRWRRAVMLVDGSLGELVGQDYVARYFPPSSKAKMQDLVANLKVAMGKRIRGNDWMSDATKQAALEKLARMEVMVGYPDKFREFDALDIRADDLYGNIKRAGKFNHDYQMNDLGQPVDRKKWGMNPQTVNAYNGFQENKIVFPAGILQPPFFDPRADDAVNYGAIGAVIGHEISHGFDDQGRKVDASGAVHDWWGEDDAKRFEARIKVFGDQYAKYEAAPGAFVNPDLTMGENIADLAGLLQALDAYHLSLGDTPAPVIDGLTGEQRLFLGYAQVWRSKYRENAIRNEVATDPHSPDRFRVLGTTRNIEAWYQAFGVQPGDAMYLPHEQRARIW